MDSRDGVETASVTTCVGGNRTLSDGGRVPNEAVVGIRNGEGRAKRSRMRSGGEIFREQALVPARTALLRRPSTTITTDTTIRSM